MWDTTLVVIAENGTGLPNANSYVYTDEGVAYHFGHLYATDWTGAADEVKSASVVMATRLIDAYYRFRGYRAHSTQALQWPRVLARDDDADPSSGYFPLALRPEYFASNIVPKLLRDATIETARELIAANRTEDPEGQGLISLALSGVMATTYDKGDQRPVIPRVAQAMLSKLGDYYEQPTGLARLVRV